MEIVTTSRGFRVLQHPSFICQQKVQLLAEASAMGPYPDSVDNPGSSYLWIGHAHRLDREEVTLLIRQMQHWLDYKRLPMEVLQ